MLNQNVANQTNEVAELDLVFINDKEVMTDSLLVAKAFGKRHDHVLRDIRELKKKIPDRKVKEGFVDSQYRGNNNEKRPCYNLSKNAALLLVGGYTGEDAVNIKCDLIEAFDFMCKEKPL